MWTKKSQHHKRYPSNHTTPSPSLPLGTLIETISRDDLDDENTLARAVITNPKVIASYNWVSGPSKIIIPGKPPKWTPLKGRKKIEFDSGEYYRDINSASYPNHPLEPSIISIMKTNPAPIPVNIVACGSTISNLLRFVSRLRTDQPFRFLVEVVGDTVHFIRRENSPKELIGGITGCGHSFPEAYTTWDHDVRRSVSHQRIMGYRFDGLDMMVRFEADGYIPSKGDKPERRQSAFTKDYNLSDIQGLGINQQKPTNTTSLIIQETKESIAQSQIFDLKTRSLHKRDQDILGDQLPRLWVSQVPKFLLAYHKSGYFDESDIEITDVKQDVEAWQEMNQKNLKKLGGILRLIIKRAKKSGKLEVVYRCEERLEIREHLGGDVLSDSVKDKWEKWLTGIKV